MGIPIVPPQVDITIHILHLIDTNHLTLHDKFTLKITNKGIIQDKGHLVVIIILKCAQMITNTLGIIVPHGMSTITDAAQTMKCNLPLQENITNTRGVPILDLLQILIHVPTTHHITVHTIFIHRKRLLRVLPHLLNHPTNHQKGSPIGHSIIQERERRPLTASSLQHKLLIFPAILIHLGILHLLGYISQPLTATNNPRLLNLVKDLHQHRQNIHIRIRA